MSKHTIPPHEVADRLLDVVDRAATQLRALEAEAAAKRPAPGKWSPKEILGHLIDSATNNHQRFVRAQAVEAVTFPRYEQDRWVSCQNYQASPWPELVDFWRLYNRHVAHVMRHIPDDKLAVMCTIAPYEPMTLAYLVEDYLVHLQHHLGHIVDL